MFDSLHAAHYEGLFLCLITLLFLLNFVLRVASSRANAQGTSDTPATRQILSAPNPGNAPNGVILDEIRKAFKISEHQTATSIREVTEIFESRMADINTSLEILAIQSRPVNTSQIAESAQIGIGKRMDDQASTISKIVTNQAEVERRTEHIQHLLEGNLEYQKNEFMTVAQRLEKIELAFANNAHMENSLQETLKNAFETHMNDLVLNHKLSDISKQSQNTQTSSACSGSASHQGMSYTGNCLSPNKAATVEDPKTNPDDIDLERIKPQDELVMNMFTEQNVGLQREISDLKTGQKNLEKIMEEGKKEVAALRTRNSALLSQQQVLSTELQDTKNELCEMCKSRHSEDQTHEKSKKDLERANSKTIEKLRVAESEFRDERKISQRIEEEKAQVEVQRDDLLGQIHRHQTEAEQLKYQLHVSMTKLRACGHEIAALRLENGPLKVKAQHLRFQGAEKDAQISSKDSRSKQLTASYRRAVREIQYQRYQKERRKYEVLQAGLEIKMLQKTCEEEKKRRAQLKEPHPSEPSNTQKETGQSNVKAGCNDAGARGSSMKPAEKAHGEPIQETEGKKEESMAHVSPCVSADKHTSKDDVRTKSAASPPQPAPESSTSTKSSEGAGQQTKGTDGEHEEHNRPAEGSKAKTAEDGEDVTPTSTSSESTQSVPPTGPAGLSEAQRDANNARTQKIEDLMQIGTQRSLREVLRIETDVILTEEVIKKAHKRLSILEHPDKHYYDQKGAHIRFTCIGIARDRLLKYLARKAAEAAKREGGLRGSRWAQV